MTITARSVLQIATTEHEGFIYNYSDIVLLLKLAIPLMALRELHAWTADIYVRANCV